MSQSDRPCRTRPSHETAAEARIGTPQIVWARRSRFPRRSARTVSVRAVSLVVFTSGAGVVFGAVRDGRSPPVALSRGLVIGWGLMWVLAVYVAPIVVGFDRWLFVRGV